MENNNDKYIGTMLDGRYEILELIGKGGMANVYKALCHKLHRYDAIKILHEDMIANKELRKRFLAESHAVAMLSHPNIVSVYDVGHSDELEYIVMELVDGVSLKRYMQYKEILPYNEVLEISTQISKALAHAHSRGIIHRDIKPQNIMLLRDGLVKVADFGIAALQNDIDTPANQAVGSVHYIAPEQARGGAADGRSDVYSLGIVMYEMLTGKLPYTGETDVEIAVKHMNIDAVPPREIVPDIPEEIERITLKAMSTDIKDRYQSAQEMLDDLESFRNAELAAQLKAESTDEDEPSAETRHHRREKSKKAAFTTGVIGVLIVALLAFAFINRYFLKNLFGSPERIEIDNFVGRYYEDVINDPDYAKLYSFTVTFKIDPETEYGIIIQQDPEAEKSKAANDKGIEVELIVSSGEAIPNDEESVTVPYVVNVDRASAISAIKKAGFEYSTSESASESVTKGYVISTEPAAGEKIPKGSTVSIVVSAGPDVVTVPVPQLKGLSKDAAIAKIESNNLSVGSVENVDSDLEEGTVIWQSVTAGTPVEAHYKISIQISAGPGGEG